MNSIYLTFSKILQYCDQHKFGSESFKNRKGNPKKLNQLSPRSHPRHLVGKRRAQKDAITDITSDCQVNSYFPYR